jgi:hypothetical protein
VARTVERILWQQKREREALRALEHDMKIRVRERVGEINEERRLLDLQISRESRAVKAAERRTGVMETPEARQQRLALNADRRARLTAMMRTAERDERERPYARGRAPLLREADGVMHEAQADGAAHGAGADGVMHEARPVHTETSRLDKLRALLREQP